MCRITMWQIRHSVKINLSINNVTQSFLKNEKQTRYCMYTAKHVLSIPVEIQM